MLVFLLSLALLGMVLCIGALVVQAICIIPLSILGGAAEAGRFVQLSGNDASLRPRTERRAPSARSGHRPALTLAAAEAR